eukprot:1157247-Pelagomonas_calceolata.AAC.3
MVEGTRPAKYVPFAEGQAMQSKSSLCRVRAAYAEQEQHMQSKSSCKKSWRNGLPFQRARLTLKAQHVMTSNKGL